MAYTMADDVRALASWYAYAVRYELRETWDELPGPWYVKVLLILACLAIPGYLDEVALVALVKFARSRKARKEARQRARSAGSAP
jgi:hypothetical protein